MKMPSHRFSSVRMRALSLQRREKNLSFLSDQQELLAVQLSVKFRCKRSRSSPIRGKFEESNLFFPRIHFLSARPERSFRHFFVCVFVFPQFPVIFVEWCSKCFFPCFVFACLSCADRNGEKERSELEGSSNKDN